MTKEKIRRKFLEENPSALRNLEVTLDGVSVASTSEVSTAAMLVFVMS